MANGGEGVIRFVCSNCARRFSTRSEVKPGAVYRHRCRCGTVIRVEAPAGEAPPVPRAAPAPVAMPAARSEDAVAGEAGWAGSAGIAPEELEAFLTAAMAPPVAGGAPLAVGGPPSAVPVMDLQDLLLKDVGTPAAAEDVDEALFGDMDSPMAIDIDVEGPSLTRPLLAAAPDHSDLPAPAAPSAAPPRLAGGRARPLLVRAAAWAAAACVCAGGGAAAMWLHLRGAETPPAAVLAAACEDVRGRTAPSTSTAPAGAGESPAASGAGDLGAAR